VLVPSTDPPDEPEEGVAVLRMVVPPGVLVASVLPPVDPVVGVLVLRLVPPEEPPDEELPVVGHRLAPVTGTIGVVVPRLVIGVPVPRLDMGVLVPSSDPEDVLVLKADPEDVLVLKADPEDVLVPKADPEDVLVLSADPPEEVSVPRPVTGTIAVSVPRAEVERLGVSAVNP